jgi:ABC-2 type transport system permease protein
MPTWLRVINRVNPLSYEVDALRGLLLRQPTNLLVDLAVLVGCVILGVAAASGLLRRLSR